MHCRANGRSDFTKLIGDAQRVQSLGGNWSLLGALTGQYGFNSLLASEQFGVGGVNFVRAYDPAELTGDSGIAGKLELQYGEKGTNIGLASYQLYAYYDADQALTMAKATGRNNKPETRRFMETPSPGGWRPGMRRPTGLRARSARAGREH